MARTSPSGTSTRTIPAPEAGGGGGGGGGGGNPWTSFQDLTDPTDGWTIHDGSGVNSDTTLAMDGDVLVFNHPTASKLFHRGSTMMGKVMIRNNHLKMVEDAGLQQPAGVAAHLLQPEAALLKLEVVFDTDNGGPINGVSSFGSWGHNMKVTAGLVGYKTDQNGNPAIPVGSNTIWLGAQVRKQYGGNPATSTSTSLYQSGWETYFAQNGVVNGYTWKNMQNPPAAAHDSLVFMMSPLRKGAAAGSSNMYTWGGSYAKDQPWNPIAMGGNFIDQQINFWNSAGGAQVYWHLAIFFGSENATVLGNIRIKKINYLLQPLVGRTNIT